ncbi:hypothetical protein OBP_250 [Pseudomonas phage OBP]|uniref:hypothetical protein n=1 Tax=Pseudomonas phage OBP TaxID=1124849 RepID=UPI000240D5DE|nr:hypothetical protein OBP_250 [Pseudomonas phage OBP]AEV89687.1 hypothetical protein OBP_250 [Pseudomonas phage OBP]
MSDVYKEAVAGGIRGAASYLADKVTGKKTVEPEVELTLEEMADHKRNAKKNYRGGCIGVAGAVLLELMSPTGSKTSALAAGLAGAFVLHHSKGVLDAAPQNTVIATTAGASAGWISMVVGRTMASYFPGNGE